MHTGLLILRWIGAVVLAFHLFVAALVFGVFILRQFGTNADWPIALAATVAVIGGAMVVPRDQRRTAVLALWLLALLYPLWMFLRGTLSGEPSVGALSGLLYTLSGGYFAWYLVKGGFVGRTNGRRVSGHPASP